MLIPPGRSSCLVCMALLTHSGSCTISLLLRWLSLTCPPSSPRQVWCGESGARSSRSSSCQGVEDRQQAHDRLDAEITVTNAARMQSTKQQSVIWLPHHALVQPGAFSPPPPPPPPGAGPPPPPRGRGGPKSCAGMDESAVGEPDYRPLLRALQP
jgi:hypothetical protein